jgi:CubicO group peptidase (beta-lactamase class C family)
MRLVMGSRASLESLLQKRLDRAVREDQAVHGGVLRIDAPGFAWQGAAGVADPAAGVAMCPEDQFQAASITKMLTATTFMTLVEAGLADLDAAIGRYLPASLPDGLHDHLGRAWGPELTPRQLLAHTSGVADFFGDGEPGAGGVLPFVAKMRGDPDRLWDPRDILAWTRANLRPHFAPGRGWHYADTGYVVVGLMIEAITGSPLHQAMRERILDPLGIEHTYMLFRERARASLPSRDSSNAYAGNAPYGVHRSVSADWGAAASWSRPPIWPGSCEPSLTIASFATPARDDRCSPGRLPASRASATASGSAASPWRTWACRGSASSGATPAFSSLSCCIGPSAMLCSAEP